jgi:hypothetical protein
MRHYNLPRKPVKILPSPLPFRRIAESRQAVGQFDSLSTMVFLNDPCFQEGRLALGGIGECILAHEWTHFFQYTVTASGAYVAHARRTIVDFEWQIIRYLLNKKFGSMSLPLLSDEMTEISDLSDTMEALLGIANSINQFLYSDWTPYLNILGQDEKLLSTSVLAGRNPIALNPQTGQFGFFLSNHSGKNENVEIEFPITLGQIVEFMAFAVEYRLSKHLKVSQAEYDEYFGLFSPWKFDYTAPFIYLFQGVIRGLDNSLERTLFLLNYDLQITTQISSIIIFACLVTLIVTWHPASVWKCRNYSPGVIFASLLQYIITHQKSFQAACENGPSLLGFADEVTAELGFAAFTRCIQETMSHQQLTLQVFKDLKIDGYLALLREPSWVTGLRRDSQKMILDDGLVLIDPLRWHGKIPDPRYFVRTDKRVLELQMSGYSPVGNNENIYDVWKVDHILGQLLYGNHLGCFNIEKGAPQIFPCTDYANCLHRIEALRLVQRSNSIDSYLSHCTNNAWQDEVVNMVRLLTTK